jgi:hypothetical protein
VWLLANSFEHLLSLDENENALLIRVPRELVEKALLAIGKTGEWRAISEAPRDGRQIDLWCLRMTERTTKGYRVTNAMWMQGKWQFMEDHQLIDVEEWNVSRRIVATHYMIVRGPVADEQD